MQLTIKGEKELYGRLKRADKAINSTFWGLVRTDLKDTLKDNVEPHKKSGTLQRNVYAKKIDNGVEGGIRDNGMMVTWNGLKINYAVFVNSGTRDHDVSPKKKKALRWVGSNGSFYFSKGHTVKGIKASHFIERTAKETFGRLDEMFTKALRKEDVL